MICNHDALVQLCEKSWDNDEFIDNPACPTCGKKQNDLRADLDDYDPLTKPSQQPHGDCTLYCNQCQMYVKPTSFNGENDICPYHQRVAYTEDGPEMMYDEFNEDGEEW